jgi:hypothetical protein
VLDLALDGLPAAAQPGQRDGPRLIARCDSAGVTHGFAGACRDRGGRVQFRARGDRRCP